MKHHYSTVPVLVLGMLLGAHTGLLRAQDTQSVAASDPAQAQTADPSQPAAPELQTSPTRSMEDFEPKADAEYELGPGDEISLDFPGKPDLATKRIIGPDGRVSLPLAGSIDLTDKTRSQASAAIANGLAPYYKDLTVTVNVEKYGSNRVIVLGNVKNPGVLYFEGTPTLLDVIARGGLMAASTSSAAAIGGTHDGIPERCAIYRGNDQVMWIDLRAMLKGGNAMADLRLKRNDVVFVPAQQELFVSVLGAVNHPGAVALTSDTTLVSVLAQAGGQMDGAGKNIQIIDPSSGKTTTVSFKDLMTPKGVDEVKLHGGDVILVPKSGFAKATYVLDKLSPLTQMGTMAMWAIAP